MNVDTRNRWWTLTANAGVIIGLIFLALEIRQNTEVARSVVDLEITTLSTDFHMRLAENPGLARAYYTGLRDPDSLTEDERIQLHYLIPGLPSFRRRTQAIHSRFSSRGRLDTL